MSDAKGYEVCDPDRDNERWVRIAKATSEREAVRQFLMDEEYDERDFDTGRPFKLLAREDEDSDPVEVAVRVIPMHFEVT